MPRSVASANGAMSVRRAQAFLRDHYADDVSLDDLAQAADGVSKRFSSCAAASSRQIGFPPHVYQIYLRN